MTPSRIPVLLALLALIAGLPPATGCSDNSRVAITSPFFFSDTEFFQSDLAGRWSGTLRFDNDAYTVYIEVASNGVLLGGLESDQDTIIDGFFRLVDTFDGETDMRWETDSGEVITALGNLEVGYNRIDGIFQSSQGFSGTLSLARSFGPGTFALPFIQFDYDIEFTDLNFNQRSQGQLAIIFSGYVEIGGNIDGVGIINGQYLILDTGTGEFSGFISLLNGDVITVTGLISLADGVLAGLALGGALGPELFAQYRVIGP